MVVDGEHLTREDVVRVARLGETVVLAEEARRRVERSRRVVEDLIARGETVYGVTTGVGELREVRIPPEDVEALQRNVVRSHASGVGPPLPPEAVRALILLRINALARGLSGIRPETLEKLVAMLNLDLLPLVPSQGSVGASGDLAPLAHVALALMGEGEATWRGRKATAGELLREAGLEPARLQAKEGLALINGTQFMTGIGILVSWDGDRLLEAADGAAALTLEALGANRAAFHPFVHALRPHPGQVETARRILQLTRGSHRLDSPQAAARVQDAYSLRCVPQVHGASRDALAYVARVLELEACSVTDNPLVIPPEAMEDLRDRSAADGGPGPWEMERSDPGSGLVLNGGNFHGQPVAIAMDLAAIALAEVASISERRIERLVNPHLSGLPPFLSPNGGLNAGYMVAQYAAAALVSENKSLAHPASVDSIPTSANQEDHVSMGSIAARHAAQVLENARRVVAVELLCAAQAVDLSGGPDGLGEGSRAVYREVRENVPSLQEDRPLREEIEEMAERIALGVFQEAVVPMGRT
ncbi:histidine ammonia-lyase [Limnochorda pilosa]|uniref:Histidine ammonia-lyase n=1 Tax=Limnochorda pilosa TaxID=1555112 RepID=A0A0K2SG88_LIMPI|nr:histidine ammonia-lyase [Limnochorda pilosa]